MTHITDTPSLYEARQDGATVAAAVPTSAGDWIVGADSPPRVIHCRTRDDAVAAVRQIAGLGR